MLARLADRRRDKYELDRGLPGTRDDDLFPALSGGDELGEVGLGVMDVEFHKS